MVKKLLSDLDLEMTLVRPYIIGAVSKDFMKFILSVLHRFYEGINRAPSYVEVLIYGSSSDKVRYLLSESISNNVLALGLDYATFHEAWRGWPRIHIDYEVCSNLSRDIVEALIVHEAVHSVLHGSLNAYLIALGLGSDIPEWLDYNDYIKLIYISSTIIKDHEVCLYLRSKRLENYISNYLKYIINDLMRHECINLLDIATLLKLLSAISCVKSMDELRNLVRDSCKDYIKFLHDVEVITHSNQDISFKARKLSNLIVNAWMNINTTITKNIK